MPKHPYRICQHGLNQGLCRQRACEQEYWNVVDYGTPLPPKPKPDLGAGIAYRHRGSHPTMQVYKRTPKEPAKEPWPSIYDEPSTHTTVFHTPEEPTELKRYTQILNQSTAMADFVDKHIANIKAIEGCPRKYTYGVDPGNKDATSLMEITLVNSPLNATKFRQKYLTNIVAIEAWHKRIIDEVFRAHSTAFVIDPAKLEPTGLQGYRPSLIIADDIASASIVKTGPDTWEIKS